MSLFTLQETKQTTAEITLHRYTTDEPFQLIEKFQNYASLGGKSEHFQSNHLNKTWFVIKGGQAQNQYACPLDALKSSD